MENSSILNAISTCGKGIPAGLRQDNVDSKIPLTALTFKKSEHSTRAEPAAELP